MPELGNNLSLHDPRNYNLKKHMVRLAVYELTKLIAPNNVSTVRMRDYEDSMKWLNDAAKLYTRNTLQLFPSSYARYAKHHLNSRYQLPQCIGEDTRYNLPTEREKRSVGKGYSTTARTGRKSLEKGRRTETIENGTFCT